jgi:hypothetical protein
MEKFSVAELGQNLEEQIHNILSLYTVPKKCELFHDI